MIELSIIIPVYNESRIIRQNLGEVDSYLQTLGIEYDIIVVNDGSLDDTLQEANRMSGNRISVISYDENRGKGFAVNRGMRAARGRFRLFMDIDLSTDLAEIPKFLQCVRDGSCDICVGNRNSVGILAQKRPWKRALFGKVFALLSSASCGYRMDDFTCGFKIFTAHASEMVMPHQQIYDWAFDTELISIAHHLGLRIRQEPVVWQHHLDSKVRIGPAIISSMKGLVKIWKIKRSYHGIHGRF